ncbi:MAG: PulJ/GspJ family protein [Planctomycetota bacterium]
MPCTRTPSTNRPATRGFTLVELLIATTLGAVLMVATAMSTGLFAQTVAHLEENSADEVDVALARIASDVRYAWWVDSPTRQSLRVCDALGAITSYLLDGDRLTVRLPSGATGVLAQGVSSLVFEPGNLRRLREGPTSSASGVLFEDARPLTGIDSVDLPNGSQVAVAFTLAESTGRGALADVNESLVVGSAETLRLGIAVAEGVAGKMYFELYESAAHGDARPRPGSAALGTAEIAIAALPRTALDLTRITDRFGNISMCFRGANVSVALSLASLYFLNGATVGSCGTIKSPFAPPATETTLNLAFHNVRLRPGIGYTLVMTMSGLGEISVLAGEAKTAGWDVVQRASAAAAFAPLGMSIPFRLSGDRVLTSTAESQVVASVTTHVTLSSGVKRSGSAAVTSQTVAQDPWMGVVPGEAAPAR